MLTWEQHRGKDVVDSYRVSYKYIVKQCSRLSQNYTVLLNSSSLRSYNLINSSTTPVEEDSLYIIMLSAMNSIAQSENVVINVTTVQAGMYILIVMKFFTKNACCTFQLLQVHLLT